MGINATITDRAHVEAGFIVDSYLALRDASDELLVFARMKNWDALLTAQANYLKKIEVVGQISSFEGLSQPDYELVKSCITVSQGNAKEIAFVLGRRQDEIGALIKTEQRKGEVVALYGNQTRLAAAAGA